MSLRYLFFLIIFILSVSTLKAQSAKQYKKAGDKAFDAGDYITASQNYEKAYVISPIEMLEYQMAVSLFYQRNYEKALVLFIKLTENSLSKYPMSEWFLAQTYHALGQYQRANLSYHNYYKAHRKQRDFYTLKAKQGITASEKAFDFSLDPDTSCDIHLMEELTMDGHSELQFVNYKPNEQYLVAKRPMFNNDSLFTSRVFLWQNDSLIPLDTNINFYPANIGAISLNTEGNEAYFSVCELVNDKKICSIYQSKKLNGAWQKAEKFDENINFEAANNIHPYYFEKNNHSYILFASDVKDGEGGYDIYYTEKESGRFKKAKNLGRRINSIDDEITPYYSVEENRLYFSSKWYENLGGFDIFYADGDIETLDLPINLGLPINSSYDDLYYNQSNYTNVAYLSSNRLNPEALKSETCCNNIYTYSLPERIIDSVPDTNWVVKSVEKMEQLIPIDLYFDNDHPNPKTTDTSTNFTYEQTYVAYFKKLKEYEDEFSFGLKKEAKSNAVNMIDNFFFEKVEKGFDQLKDFNQMLIQLLRDGYNVELVVKGFASPLNSNSYNINLSKRRVSSIVNYYRKTEDGLFAEYIDGETPQLILKEEAFGEDTASRKVSDDRNDKKNSIYSPWAAEERRVQLLAFKLEK
ncbi:MAG: hypothetical protein JXR60_08935 [Bacteroidales bacterium]|nr:hypothetical protein [Bacteroidales bacterium]